MNGAVSNVQKYGDELRSREGSNQAPASATNAIIAACVAAIGAFVFGYSLGFTSPVLTAMSLLKNDAVFTDASLDVVCFTIEAMDPQNPHTANPPASY